MKKILFLLSIVFFVFLCYGQKHDYIWMNGNIWPENYILDFNQYPPVTYKTNTNYPFSVCKLTFADSTGRLLFYTNGCSMKNDQHQDVQGGEKINQGEGHELWCPPNGSGYRMINSLICLPFANHRYRLFHIRTYPVSTPFEQWNCINQDILVSELDFSVPGGRVVYKDSALFHECFQHIAATRHANGQDWWLIANSNKTDTFYRFLVTPDAIQGPWKQLLPEYPKDDFTTGHSLFSFDGRYYANSFRFGFTFYEFDRCSGLLFNPRTVIDTTNAWSSMAFSSDNRYLYFSTLVGDTLFQYDVKAKDLMKSRLPGAIYDGYRDPVNRGKTGFGWLQSGPDGRIYVNSIWEYGHIMPYPNRKGLATGMLQRAMRDPLLIGIWPQNHPNYHLPLLHHLPRLLHH
jgi:hypothetical protein